MPSSASPLKLRFLLDENVNRRLGGFLSAQLLKEKQKASYFEGNLIKLVEHTYEIRPLFNARDLK